MKFQVNFDRKFDSDMQSSVSITGEFSPSPSNFPLWSAATTIRVANSAASGYVNLITACSGY